MTRSATKKNSKNKPKKGPVVDGQFDDPVDEKPRVPTPPPLGVIPPSGNMIALQKQQQQQHQVKIALQQPTDLVRPSEGEETSAKPSVSQQKQGDANATATANAPILPLPPATKNGNPSTTNTTNPPLKTGLDSSAPAMQPKQASSSSSSSPDAPPVAYPVPAQEPPPMQAAQMPSPAERPTHFETTPAYRVPSPGKKKKDDDEEKTDNTFVVSTPQWQIPFSHNYHPAYGFRQSLPAEKDGKSTQGATASNKDAEAEKAVANGEETEDLNRFPPMANAYFEKDNLPFPVVKDDCTTKTFGIQESEINDVDVLCGRGGMTNAHPGNVHYRKLTDHYRLHYASAKKCFKANVAKAIVRAIRNRHGRFLRKNLADGCWYEIGDMAAKEKASQTLREGLAKIVRSSIEKDLRKQVAEAIEDAKKREFFEQELEDSKAASAAKKQKQAQV